MKGLAYFPVGLVVIGLCSALPAGREFATSFMQNLGGDGKDTRFSVEVAALPSSQGRTTVKVTAEGEVNVEEIEPGKSFSFKLPISVEMKGSKKSNQTVLIEASQDVSVTSLNFKQYTADTSVVYPVKDWGTEYYIFTPTGDQSNGIKEFSITNHKEPNTVEISLQGSVRFLGKYYKRGSTMTIKLEAFEAVQIQSGENLSGTKVVSHLPVAVSSGHSCVQKFTSCNHVYEQLLPVYSWGKEFIIAPLPYHNMFTSPYDSVYVQASEPTKIRMSINGRVQNYAMHAGETREIKSYWPNAIYLTSDKGVQVLFEFNGGPIDFLDHADPFLMTILPTIHFSTSYALEGQGGFYNTIIAVARNKDLADIKIDPKPKSENFDWHKVDGTDFSWAKMQYSTGATFYQISHPSSPFGVYSLGVASANGYGSPASGETAEKRDCSTMKCPEDEVCKMSRNSPTCVKKPPAVKAGTCWAMGDPHYRTFDGSYYNFMGNCTYTMVKNCHAGENLPAFEVDAQNTKRTGSEVTFIGKVIIKVHGYTLAIVRSEFGLVQMNYTMWNLPINLGNGKVKLSQSGLSVIVETDFGLTVQYDWKEYLVISLPGTFSGKVCGMCGNFNTKKEDDFVTSTGSQTNNVVTFGKSWKVTDGPHDSQCRDECPGNCETCENHSLLGRLKDKLFCSLLTTVMDGPLSDCNAVLDPKVLHEMCMYDVCMGEGMKNFMCDTLQVYADACQRAGVKIYDWRHLAHCSEPRCAENSHYEFCGNACPATCENPDAVKNCKENCVETCVCDEGFLLSGTACVPKAQCGCSYKGFYIEAEGSFFTDNCTEKCTCDQHTKQVKCETPGCQQGFECKMVDQLLGCQPVSYSECNMTAGPHIETFDRLDYNFNGTCVYELAGVCMKDPSLQQFKVLVRIVDSGAMLVEVNIHGSSIVLARGHKGSVLINGKNTSLPFKGNVTVRQFDDHAVIETKFGVHVSYNWNSRVQVKVPSTYAGAMCGLCGNYNSNPKDDLRLKNGTLAVSADELGKSWRDNDQSCQESATCTISGDPHYKNFKQHYFDFQGTCSYTAAKLCHQEESHHHNFSVVVENEKWTMTDKPNLAVATLVAVQVYGHTLILRRNQTQSLMVDDILTNIPFNLNDGQVKVFQEGFAYAIVVDFGLKVTYDMVYKIEVIIPANLINKTCGLCGSYENKTDSFQLPNGKMTKEIKTFGAAWKTPAPGVVCEDGCTGDQCPKCNDAQKKIYEKDCGRILDPNGTFAACHSKLSPEYYYRDCVYDVCMSQGDRTVLCNSISAYVRDCQTLKVKLDNWRTPDFCPAQCSENSHYDICSGACAYPCPGLTASMTCPTTCREGCTCKEGYYFNGTGCVAQKDCSCYHEGRTFKIGESMVTDDCHQRCVCTASGEVKCEDFSCNAMENCRGENHILGCHPKQCLVETGGSITLFSGKTGAISVMGAYEIITHCNKSAVEWFRVVVMFQECRLSGVRRVVAIYLYFNDLSITVTDKQEIWVNGKKVTSPSRPRNDISVRSSGRVILVEQLSTFKLQFSYTQEISVTVSDSMAANVCGACGKLLPFRDIMLFSVGTMQDHMAQFAAQDFPTCGL